MQKIYLIQNLFCLNLNILLVVNYNLFQNLLFRNYYVGEMLYSKCSKILTDNTNLLP